MEIVYQFCYLIPFLVLPLFIFFAFSEFHRISPEISNLKKIEFIEYITYVCRKCMFLVARTYIFTKKTFWDDSTSIILAFSIFRKFHDFFTDIMIFWKSSKNRVPGLQSPKKCLNINFWSRFFFSRKIYNFCSRTV